MTRFIPARAGNAFEIERHWVALPVHPRACGERTADECRMIVQGGSSPRVRGTRMTAQEDTAKARFIPARAGNAAPGRLQWAWLSVHPRACGEREEAAMPDYDEAGSSPRVRGTPLLRQSRCALRRFIPARAGNARYPAITPPVTTVHPRACGERSRAPAPCDRRNGSSPRVRGTLHVLMTGSS